MATFPAVTRFTIEGHEVKPGEGVQAVNFDGSQYVVEYAERRFDTIDEVIESGALIEVEPEPSR